MLKNKLKDHREIAREMDLFSFHEYAPGAIFWHPKGLKIYHILEDFIRKKTENEGYREISTPVIVKSELFKKSGHWQHFGENIFSLKVDDEVYALKPMNCPESTLVFSAHTRSYQDLPLRLSEFGILHRNELSGVLGGALRVRQFTIDDAHIYVTPEQIHDEIIKLILMTIDVYKTLDYKPRFYLATRPEKAMGNTKSWQQAEKSLEKALKSTGVDFSIKPKEGAFYGPKIDIHILDSQKRDWQMATIQLDFQIPESMQLSYVDKDGAKKRPVMIHRGIFGSLERFIGILIEHTQGKLPLWLTPTQTIIMPITNKQNAYAKKVVTSLIKASIRSQLDERNETLQAKIRDAILQKIPYLVIVGEKEEKANLITVRTREGKNLEKQKVSSFINRLVKKIENKS
ncbi:threonine--tRNA ligase [Candidatus Curtissbacteria bacterium RIFCSPLOWO2_02_FULL_40_11]|uniref:Threonine--tRNA ligase n=1 Tax=Candidatus Curtissbacteria bacterium RIFCSPLOWO2_12_FULL_38_9 TaxID=1797735 RepID=A0A1F5IAG9_9BACT|nr:MAG: threonine--tRNA ligase [Candidatus Curtissbacteria bacterium RIFCSPHIGHO2_01_FULL_39_57]OGD89973.1 MAG: threonine--tRNA ligase [Candidatus Curtissbacteria bacterium RIFCSPHIGHO2_12_FULL_38_37]OGE00677.1 MAG: threonine--tRNA ligase [Candidatus Curtissbacteria bacterium RIFCSPLOWO2_02_FULL_40_11]OGE13352.1 MAG: threonine--tRNA ligase [Candidatus Curtissbacteria bacterium RIFCSPLOWO2_12_FULL_38_9]